MQKRTINPTPWLQHFNMNHAIEVKGGERTLYLSGQTASAPDASALNPGDLVAQFKTAWDNLKAALAEADMQPAHVVRMNIYTTDIALFMENAGDIIPIFTTMASVQIAPALTRQARCHLSWSAPRCTCQHLWQIGVGPQIFSKGRRRMHGKGFSR